MTWRASPYVAAGALAACLLVWAAHEAWPSREIPIALPIVVTSAYDEWADTLGRREMLSDVLARGGITGREYVRFMKATHALNPRHLQPGLIFELRRLKGGTIANRLGVRLDPENHLVMARRGGDSGWTETVEEIPWTTERLRTTAVIQSNLYDALDAAIPDSFLPPGQRVALAWKIAEVFDWEVDFTRDIRPGDRVEVLIERLQSPEGEKRFSRILAARVDVARAPTFAFAFDAPDGQTGFYDEKGRSLRRASAISPAGSAGAFTRFSGGGEATRGPTTRRPTARQCAPPQTGSSPRRAAMADTATWSRSATPTVFAPATATSPASPWAFMRGSAWLRSRSSAMSARLAWRPARTCTTSSW